MSIEIYIRVVLVLPPILSATMVKPAGVHVENVGEKLKPDKSSHTRRRLFCPHFFHCLFLSLQVLEWLSFPILSSCCVVCGGPTPTRSSTCHCKSVFPAADGEIYSSLPPQACRCFQPKLRHKTKTQNTATLFEKYSRFVEFTLCRCGELYDFSVP